MSYRRFVSHFLAGTSIVALTVSSFFVSPIAATPKEETTEVEFERKTTLVEIVVPDRKAVEDLVVRGFDLTGYVSDRNGQLEVQAVLTDADIEMLKIKGYKVTVLQTAEEGEKLLRQQEQTEKQKQQLAQQADTVKVFRADYFKNQSGLFLYLEVKSSAGPNTVMNAEWTDEKGNKRTASMTRKVDAGEYLYHYVLTDINSVPENVVISTNQGGKVETGLTEWIGDGTPADDDYFSDFVDKYMTPTEVTERIEQLAEEFPELAEIIVLPEKTNGYRRKAQVTIGSVVNSAIVLTSKAWGHEGGNDITVDIRTPKSVNSTLDVTVDGKNIMVDLGRNSTSAEVIAAINEKAGDLVSATRYRTSNGTGVVQPQSNIKLTDNLRAPKEVSRDPFEVKAIRIGKVRDGSKPGVLGYSQEHAREWVTPLVTVETAERLLRNYHTDENTKKLVDNLDIFIVPSVNPDGGHYSFYDYNSMRRNMTNHCGPEASDPAYRNSWGVDLNRNYKIGTVWDGWIGGSKSCTSDTFAGPEPFSEPEARNLNWLAEENPNLKFAMNIHAYGGYFMWSPGAYDANRVTLPRPTAGEEAYYWQASDHILKRIKEHRGTVILPSRTGPIPDVLYSAGGNSADTLWYEHGIYAWNFEVGADLWNANTKRWTAVGFQPAFSEGHAEAMEFANGLIGMFEVAYENANDDVNPESKLVPGAGTYDNPVKIKFETSEPATVYYTLDGSRPTLKSKVIQVAGTREAAESLKIDETTVVKWFSVDAAGNIENGYNPDGDKNNYNQAKIVIDYLAEGVSANAMKKLVERFEAEGEFNGAVAARALKTHLTAVDLYEQKREAEKVIKHMGGFKTLIDQQEKGKLISGKAARILKGYADDLIEKWDTNFNPEKAMQHIHHLSVEIGPRVTGTDEERQAAQYIQNEFERLGYDVSTQEFSIRDRVSGELKIVSDNNKKLHSAVSAGSARTDKNGVTGDVFNAGLGKPENFTEEAAGKIALIERGDNTYWEKVDNAIKAGSAGVVIYNNVESLAPPNPSLGNNQSSIPVVGITQADGKALLSKLSAGGLKLNLAVQNHTNQKSQNVIAVKKPKGVANPEIVYVTAHYDSVPGSPGANDNGSGTASIMELARNLKDMPTNKEIRFIAFGAEEIGLVGSRYYVGQLSKEERDRSLVNFNLDMVGTNWDKATQLSVNTGDGKSNLAWEAGKAAAAKLGIDQKIMHMYRSGGSDHIPFYEVGIASALYIWEEPVVHRLEPWYHTPGDVIENVSPERMGIIGSIINQAVADLMAQQGAQSKKAS
ncbi:M20/M25/M40 family metallo-hydrolase [Siminovitchia acidinfaciens]|uniref:M20/M25/M40 family metallo-hydrolase n=1 Tax=Siminovitchia acidinfaciens TaxID=2321395 RepID=A0A429XWH4_9BACI|nr:M28 family peptidase [Siminovitchia acidinfaciens]RST72740.1 M20/M25/M40 family metallo-hydrolase [Siminovitchia acidinfaciens]